MKKEKSKFVRNLPKIGTGVMVFAASLAGTYFLIPKQTRVIDLTPKMIEGGNGNSIMPDHFQLFVNRLKRDVGLSEEEVKVYNGLTASFDNFKVSYTTENSSAINNIAVDGDIEFLMKGLKDIQFNVALDVDYNGKNIPLEIGYNNATVFFGLKDLRLKCSSTTAPELIDVMKECFEASVEEGGLNIDLDRLIDEKINGVFDNLFNNIDLGSLMSTMGEGELAPSFSITEEQDIVTNDWDFTISVILKEKDEVTEEITENPINIVITTTEEYALKRVDLGTINLGNVTISGALNLEVVPNLKVLSPENPLSPAYNESYTYHEIVNYKGWIRRIADLLGEDEQKFALSFALDLDQKETSNTKAISISDIARLEGSINVDFSDLIDWDNFEYLNKDTEEEEIGVNPGTSGAAKRGLLSSKDNGEESLVDRILNKVTLGLNVNFIGQNDVNYGNLSISYVDGAGYLNLNESTDSNTKSKSSVLKAKLDTETFNWMLNELPEMFSSLSGDENDSSIENLFSFITDSDFISGIKDGDYSVVLDVLSNLSNDDEKIYLGLDLSSLGLGDDASIDLTLDSRYEEELDNKVLSLNIKNIAFGDFELNATIENEEYTPVVVDEAESYDSLSFLPGVFDQVSGILNSKQAGFEISGSVLDDAGVGIELDGKGQFDYGNKFGFGDMTIKQYKYNHDSVWYTHEMALDVDNQGNDYKQNNVRMIYGNRDGNKNIKAQLTVQSILDIVDTVKTFLDESGDDDRFTKFLEPIMASFTSGAIGDAINNKDYLRFVKNDLLKEVKQYDNGTTLRIVVGGDVLGLGSDIVLNVKLADKDDSKVIDYLELDNLVIGEEGAEKNINLKVSLKDYDPNRVSPCDHNATYMSLDSVATLLQFGINTTQMGYYKLTANIDVNALLILNFDLSNITVHIVVDGKNVKIYGLIPDIKLTTFGSIQDNIGLTTRSAQSEFTFKTYSDNDPNKTDDIGGYFDIKRTVKSGIFSVSTNVYHYRSTSKNFMDNILTYLLVDLLSIKSSLVNMIGDLNLSKDDEPAATDFTNLFTDTGFQYNEAKKEWDVGLNLNEVTGIDALREAEIKITGVEKEGKGYLSKLVADLSIQASLVSIEIGATITLDTSNIGATDWPSSIQSAFDTIVNVSFSSSVLNKPNSYLTK